MNPPHPFPPFFKSNPVSVKVAESVMVNILHLSPSKIILPVSLALMVMSFEIKISFIV